jgi:peptide/nickel transport system permease protein
MLSYLLRRIAGLVPLMIGISLICFLVVHLAPGEPSVIQGEMGKRSTAELREQFREIYGLDKPLHEQYFGWLSRMARLDFGLSMTSDRQPVLEKIKEKLPVTILLNVVTMLVILLVSIPLGVTAATHHGKFFDKASTVAVFVGFATPAFWLALILMIVFGVWTGWLPISGLRSINFAQLNPVEQWLDIGQHLVLPVAAMTFGAFAYQSRIIRGSMLEVVRQDYIVTARAKGLSERRVIYKHALRNALLPMVTILGLSLPELIGGSVIMETVFALPGMGRLFYTAVMQRDYTTIMGVLTIGAFLTLLGNLVADVMYSVVDPRIRRG